MSVSVPGRNLKRKKVGSSSSFSPFEPPPLSSTSTTKLERFAHPSHPHKLFRNIIRNTLTFCDNLNCKRRICHNEVTYVCFRCDFDLCAWCYTLPTERSSCHLLHESDDEVNDDIFFVPKRWVTRAGVVKVKKHGRHGHLKQTNKKEEDGEDEEEDEEKEEKEEKEENREEENCDGEEENAEEEEDCTFIPTEEIRVTHETMPENKNEEDNKTIDVTVTEDEETKQIENRQDLSFSSSSSSSPSPSPILRPVATLTFESNNYDGITISNVNHLISSIQGEINIIHTTHRQ